MFFDEEKDFVYACKTDWDYHMGGDSRGVTFYFSEEALRDKRPCVEGCGIVAVKMKFDHIVQEELGDEDE